VNRSRRDDSDAHWSQSIDKLDNFWIDLNEATAMRPVAKAQIYSVKRKLTSKPSRLNVKRPWSTWKNSSKKKRKEKAKSPKKCKGIVKLVVLDVYQIFPVPYNWYL
jgi:hypothetical protein